MLGSFDAREWSLYNALHLLWFLEAEAGQKKPGRKVIDLCGVGQEGSQRPERWTLRKGSGQPVLQAGMHLPDTTHRRILTPPNGEVRASQQRGSQVTAWAIQLHTTYPQCPNCRGLGVEMTYLLAWLPFAYSSALHWAAKHDSRN